MTPDATATSIRLATEQDAAAIAAMSRDLIEHGLGWSWTAERVTQTLRRDDTNGIVAVQGPERLGFGIMRYADEHAHLMLLATLPKAARRGIGTSLLEWLERSARVAGMGRISLEVRFANIAARSFYTRLGYERVQLLPGYYSGREASVRMAKKLTAGPSGDGQDKA